MTRKFLSSPPGLLVVHVPLPRIPPLPHSPPPTARATGETDQYDDSFTVSCGWWGNVVGVRHGEMVHILEARERERESH